MSNTGTYTVRSLYQKFEEKYGPKKKVAKLIWGNAAIPKAKFMVWLAWLDRLKVADRLNKCGVINDPVEVLVSYVGTTWRRWSIFYFNAWRFGRYGLQFSNGGDYCGLYLVQ